MNKERSSFIISQLRQVIPNPVCELNFRNPFELLCAVMLSAQTTDKRVNVVSKVLFEKFPTPQSIAEAKYEEIYSIISSVGLAKTKTKHLIELGKMIHEVYHDIVPDSLDELILLPGVGRKTASVVQAVGFNIPAMPVDTHLHRLSIRLGYVKKTATVLDAEKALKRYIPKDEWIDAHHLLLLYGRYYCTAIHPKCETCSLKTVCKEKLG